MPLISTLVHPHPGNTREAQDPRANKPTEDGVLCIQVVAKKKENRQRQHRKSYFSLLIYLSISDYFSREGETQKHGIMWTNTLSWEGNIRIGEKVFPNEIQFNFNLCTYFEVKKC